MTAPRVIVPVRTGASAKRRLAHFLDARSRDELVRTLLQHVVGTLHDAGLEVVVLLSGPLADPPLAAEVVPDTGGGLNTALRTALAAYATPLLVVPADLPWLTVGDVDHLLAMRGDVVIARALDGGTNALLLRRPLEPRFGRGSAVAHAARAAAAGLGYRVVRIPGFDRDLDDHAGLVRAAGRSPGLAGWERPSAGAANRRFAVVGSRRGSGAGRIP